MLVVVVEVAHLLAAPLVVVGVEVLVALAGLLLKPLDIGLNTMTLGGLAIAVGLLVDAAIIMVENILHRLSGAATRHERRQRALTATASSPLSRAFSRRDGKLPPMTLLRSLIGLTRPVWS